MIRALNQRTRRTVFYLTFLIYMVILPARVIKCDEVNRNANQVFVCDDGEVSQHFIEYTCILGCRILNIKDKY